MRWLPLPKWSDLRVIGIVPLLVSVLMVGCTDATEDPVAARTGSSPQASAADPSSDVCFDEGRAFKGEARLYIEHNATDEDTGVHGMFDQEGLAEACIETPDGAQIMFVNPAAQLDGLGINQFFFESREPPNDEYSIADLKADFPEGDYVVSGVDYLGIERVASAVFTHDIPAPPEITAPKLVGEEKAEENVLARSGLTIRWRPVTETVDGAPVEITAYEVIVTKEDHDDTHSLSRPEYDVHVPPGFTQLPVPAAFLEPNTLYEVEVLALEKSGNQTISVGFFTTARK